MTKPDLAERIARRWMELPEGAECEDVTDLAVIVREEIAAAETRLTPETLSWLEEVKARRERTTPGPWSADRDYSVDADIEVEAGTRRVYPCATKTDYEFIAHSRADIPRLLDLVSALATREPSVEDALTRLREKFPSSYIAVRVSGSGFARNSIPCGAMVCVDNKRWDTPTLSEALAAALSEE